MMADNALQNTTDTGRSSTENSVSPASAVEDQGSELSGKTRRDAMAALAKHVAYTTPAVLAMLSLSAKRARAFSF